MWTFRAYFKKEILESIRQYKYIIIASVIIFFSIADPVMLKLLPLIMKGQSNIDISTFIPKNTSGVFQNYIKDLFQIANIVIVFLVSGTLGKEVSDGKLIFPYSKGSNPLGLVLAKVLHYILAIAIITFVGFSINYYYVNILFQGKNVTYLALMKSASLIILYFTFNILLTVMFSSIFKKEFATGIIVLFLTYFSMIFSNIKSVYGFLPGYLINAANSFGSINITKILIVTIITFIICIYISTINMKNVKL